MGTNVNNMFGGRSNHPAYDLRVELAPNQFLDGITLYTIKSVAEGHAESCVTYEDIDGVSGICGDNPKYPIPSWLRKHIQD